MGEYTFGFYYFNRLKIACEKALKDKEIGFIYSMKIICLENFSKFYFNLTAEIFSVDLNSCGNVSVE